MRIRGSLARGLLIALAVVLIPVSAVSAQKITPGSTCKVYKQKVNYQKKVYTCIKSGKKLVWNKGVAVKKATPSPTPFPTPTPSATSTPSLETFGAYLDINNCKIVDSTVNKSVQLISSGFERFTYEKFKKPLNISVIVLPISFSNMQFTDNDYVELKQQLQNVEDYFIYNSYGLAKIGFIMAEKSKWISLLKTYNDYKVSINGGPIPPDLLKDILASSDPSIDLSSYDIVEFATSPNPTFRIATGIQSNILNALDSPSGKIQNLLMVGGNSAIDWKVIAHEFGHNWLGFEDLYKQIPYSNPFGNWDLMSSIGSELLGWHRWSAGWLLDSQIHCLNKVDASLVKISSLDSVNSKILISIPIDPGKSIFIEYRTTSKYYLGNNTILAYFVDTSIWHGNAPYSIISTLKGNGDSVVYKDVKISIQSVSDSEVYVKIN